MMWPIRLLRKWSYKVLPVAFVSSGIEFKYKGDDVLFIYPWARLGDARYISWGCNGTFKTLKEIDAFWDEYDKAMPGGK